MGFNNLSTRLAEAKKASICFREILQGFFPLTKLTSEEFSQLAHRFLTLNFSNPVEEVSGGFFQSKDHISLCGRKAQIVSLLESTDEPVYSVKNSFGHHGGVTCPMTDSLGRHLPFPHIVSRTIRVIDSERFLSNHFNEFAWSLATKLDERAIQNTSYIREEMAQLEQALKERGEPIVQLSLLVIPFSDNLAAVQHHSAQILAAFSRIKMQGYMEDIDTANLYFSSIPGNGNQTYRRIPMPLYTAVAHLNFVTPFSGHTSGIILSNRYQEPIYYNPFNSDLDNQNAFIFGPSGSGKSFFNGKMIKDRFQAGHIVIVIDSGGTYRHLFKALGGKYIELTTDTALHLNPFFIPPNQDGQYIPDNNKLIFLVQLIGKMWKGDLNTNPMREAEKTLLAKWIIGYYKSIEIGSVPTLTSFYDYMQVMASQNDAMISSIKECNLFPFQEFFIVLEPFAHGQYKDHFNSTSQDYLLDNRLVCFELESLKNNSKLYPLVVQILFDFAFDMVSKNPEATKFIDIEEGWTMLDDASEEHIESFFRKGRKTKTSIRIITQNIDEIKGSRIAGAMKNNASTFMLLYNDKHSSRSAIGDFLGMSPLDMEKYASLRRRDGESGFREIFIKEMSSSHVWLLETSIWEYAMITSKPDERNKISSLTHQHGSILDGIAAWVEQENRKKHV